MTNILITGGTGFVGRNLIEEITRNDPFIEKIYVLTRDISKIQKKFSKFSNKICGFSDINDLDRDIEFEQIINLAGEPIADKKWSEKQKEIIKSSRIEVTKDLVKFIGKLKTKPSVMISASAVGYYGSHDDEPLDEDSIGKKEFTHFLCKAWENEARKVEKYGVRVCIARFGIILGKDGGALKKMLPAFRFGLGGKISSGKQIMSWIHMRDAIRGLMFLIHNENLSGEFNFCAPNAVTNDKFTKVLAKTLNRPTLFSMRLGLVKFLFGEMGETLLANGQNIYPRRLLDAGFNFKYKRIDSALRNAVK